MPHTPKPAEPEAVEVFPENWMPMQVFFGMQTQWRVGMNGATGLDYAALPVVENRLGVKKKDRAEVFEALQVLEGEMLAAWAEQRRD